MLKVLWPAVAAVALMHFIGLYVASALYIGFYMRWVRRHSWVSPSSRSPSAFLLLLPGLREMVSRGDAQRATRAMVGLLNNGHCESRPRLPDCDHLHLSAAVVHIFDSGSVRTVFKTDSALRVFIPECLVSDIVIQTTVIDINRKRTRQQETPHLCCFETIRC